MTKSAGLILAFALGALWSATSGAIAADTPAAMLSGADRQKILEDGAKKERQVLWVGSFNDDSARPIIAGFNKRYPYIKVNRVRMDSTQAAQRVLLESHAGAPQIDLITSDDVMALQRANALQPFRSPTLDSYPAQVKDATGYSAPLYFIYHGLAAWNTKLVARAEAPKTFEDLLEPKWKGQMVFAGKESGALFMFTFLRLQWGDAKAHAYIAKLAKQNVIARSESARTVLSAVGSGEYKIMIAPFVSHVGEFTKLGAPLDVSETDPVPLSEDPMLMARRAPHPCSTLLLIDYLLGPEAQAMLRNEGYFPGNPAVPPAPDMKPYLPETRGLAKYLVDDRTIAAMLSVSTDWYATLFR